MKPPFHLRKEIPFYYNKSEAEFSQDSYEKYDPAVFRQCLLHMSDSLWEKYPSQQILDYVINQIATKDSLNILELGCSVGRMIAEIAEKFPKSNCWGIDYSYQMLKKAKETWVDHESTNLNLSRFGFSHNHQIEGKALKNLRFGLSKAEDLPFDDSSQDIIFSSFLLDRLHDPIKGLKEMKRILSPDGKLIIVSPLNFVQTKQWDKLYPPIKIYNILNKMQLGIEDWQEEMMVEEPMDARGNLVQWNCIAMICKIQKIEK